MPPAPLPTQVLALLARSLPSIAHVEGLLLLFRTQPQAWRPGDAASELRISSLIAAGALADLQASELVVNAGTDDDPQYAYRPGNEADDAVRELLEAYNRRPVTLINALYKQQAPAAQAFADAFRFRRDNG